MALRLIQNVLPAECTHPAPPIGGARRAAAIALIGLTMIVVPVFSQSLKELYKDDFLVGAALNARQIGGADERAKPLLERHFNVFTAENAMKWALVHPKPGSYDFSVGDKLIEYAEKRRLNVIGHTLVWHNQTPKWVFEDEKGGPVSRDELLRRMREHIFAVVGRWKGRVKGWDVVNEALNEDGTLRRSKWLEIIGEDYIAKAFEYAHEADPNAELYYNDYSLEAAPKRDGAVRLVESLRAKKVFITGVGTQGHWHLDFPSAAEIERTLDTLGRLGPVSVTELDVDVLPTPEGFRDAEVTANFKLLEQYDPYRNSLPAEVEAKLAARYGEIFAIFKKHRDQVARVTFWGVTDGDSWKNNFPVRGRTNYPLLFDRQGRPKPAFEAVAKAAQTIKKTK